MVTPIHTPPPLAQRLSQLGTENAFAVSAAATAWAAQGNRVYPFHLGDINLPTPPHIAEAMARAIADSKTGYCAPAGIAPLRAALADDVGALRGVRFGPEHVAVQTGGKPVITKFLQAVMNPGDEVLYPSPGFPIYESQIDYLGGVAVPYGFLETPRGMRLDVAAIEAKITPRTRAIIYNNCENPTAAESDAREVDALADLVLRHNLWVLADDAYAEVRYSGNTEFLISRPGLKERTITLYTFSKKYAMTGWRLGAALGPQRVIERITQINVNDESCTSQPVQWAGLAALTGDQAPARHLLAALRERRDAAVQGLCSIEGMNTATPASAFYVFPEVSGAMRKRGFDNVNAFATAALHATGVSFCTRDHFNRRLPGETGQFARFAYSGIGVADIRDGLARLKAWVEA
jgi:aspartate/methionine/tyrosine aminotransferase